MLNGKGDYYLIYYSPQHNFNLCSHAATGKRLFF
jgi:hypothetical protein